MSDEMDEIIGEFIVETRESLDELDRQLVRLEQHPDVDSLAKIFRATHTVKGTAGFLGLTTLESVTHVGENLLSKLRDGLLDVDRDVTTALLRMVDTIREIIDTIESSGEEGDHDVDDIVAELTRLDAGRPLDADTEPETAAEIDTVAEPGTDTSIGGDADPAVDVDVDADATDAMATPDGQPAAPAVAGGAATPPDERAQPLESIRVDVDLLDELMNLVGELVLARNQILQYTVTQNDSVFAATTQRLNLITTELQEGVMRTRMQPIENVWNKFPRVVRDLTVACGKSANLLMEGKHTELDKTLLEAIKDPLTHLVRNAVDHGLESAGDRIAADKPADGTIRLSAYHEGGQVIIEISDDGRGIDPDAIRRATVQKGLLTYDEAANRSDRDIVNMIFAPGFSTATQVTNISGRGVGMDVVRTNIESIGGSVDVKSVTGVGTTFKVKIPLTLAIIPALVVASAGQRYAIPQVSLVELVQADLGADPDAIEHVNGAPVFRLRGSLLPLVHLADVLEQEAEVDDVARIVVLQADGRRFGLVVDRITDTAEIVVKPLGRLLKQATAFSGATIMGDGRVALILDVLGLAQRAELGNAAIRKAQVDRPDEGDADVGATADPVLLVGIGDRRFVLPLDTVSRLEELLSSDVREAGTREVIHYRDQILPLVDLSRRLGVLADQRSETISVLVCTTPVGSIGLIVDAIHDISNERLVVSPRTAAFGVRGTTVLRGEVADVLDLDALVEENRLTHQGAV